jgi:hypothetical protein
MREMTDVECIQKDFCCPLLFKQLRKPEGIRISDRSHPTTK